MAMKLDKTELTPTQAKLWGDTRAALLWHCPAFTHILYTMLNKAGDEHIAYFTTDIPIAATDGSRLLLNPNTFFNYNLNQRIFITAHEIMHCILNHIVMMHQCKARGKVPYSDGKNIPYDQMTMNIAMDLVINDILVDSKVGEFSKDWIHDPAKAGKADSSLDAYRKIWKKPPPSGASFDLHLPPGTSQNKDAHSAAAERNEAEWGAAIAAGAHAARVQGKLPAGLERLFGELLDPAVDWRDHIRSLMNRRLGTGTYDWAKPDRRLITRDIIAPGRAGFGAGTVVVGVDTSGSVGPREVDMFLAEIGGILEDVKPKELLIMWCDAKLHRTDYCSEPSDLNEVRCKGAPGGGGTSFVPVFDEIENLGLSPDALIYLTDGQGTFPQAPGYSVIWGDIAGTTYPFGDVVRIPRQAE